MTILYIYFIYLLLQIYLSYFFKIFWTNLVILYIWAPYSFFFFFFAQNHILDLEHNYKGVVVILFIYQDLNFISNRFQGMYLWLSLLHHLYLQIHNGLDRQSHYKVWTTNMLSKNIKNYWHFSLSKKKTIFLTQNGRIFLCKPIITHINIMICVPLSHGPVSFLFFFYFF